MRHVLCLTNYDSQLLYRYIKHFCWCKYLTSIVKDYPTVYIIILNIVYFMLAQFEVGHISHQCLFINMYVYFRMFFFYFKK